MAFLFQSLSRFRLWVKRLAHAYKFTVGTQLFGFENLAEVIAKATPASRLPESAGVIASSGQERVLADVPLERFLNEALIP